jgi:hypothetical protein
MVEVFIDLVLVQEEVVSNLIAQTNLLLDKLDPLLDQQKDLQKDHRLDRLVLNHPKDLLNHQLDRQLDQISLVQDQYKDQIDQEMVIVQIDQIDL